MKPSSGLPTLSSRPLFICTQCRYGGLQQAPPAPNKRRKSWRNIDLGTGRSSFIAGSRLLHTTIIFRSQTARESQAQPLGDFYTELLSKPIPKAAKADSSLPTFVRSGDETKEERAKKLFGSIKGSGYERRTPETPDATWRTINGVPVPPRPAEPDNCCMSGCVHCVWDDYRDDIEEWAGRFRKAQAKGRTETGPISPKAHMPRPEVADASGSMDDDGGGSESLWASPSGSEAEEDMLFGGIPVGIREFMATEKRIRDRKIAQKNKKR